MVRTSHTLFWVTALVTVILTWEALTEELGQQTCDKNLGSDLSSRIQRLDEKLQIIEDLLHGKSPTTKRHTWKGNQTTFDFFKGLSNDVKEKLIKFQLEDMKNLEVSTLISQLSPCQSLESIKLTHVELRGSFPTTSEDRITLPKLNEFELNLDNYPNAGSPNILSTVVFFQHQPIPNDEFNAKTILELQANIKLVFNGSTKISIDHDFHELILDSGPVNPQIMSAAVENPAIFRLKKLTMKQSDLNLSLVPSDLSYLNLKQVHVDSTLRPTTQYDDLLKKLNKVLKSLHIDVDYNKDFNSLINFSDLPLYLHAISFRHVRLNMTGRLSQFDLKTLLLDRCLIDDKVIDRMYNSFRHVEKIAIVFEPMRLNETQCHRLLYRIVDNEVYMPRLDSIFIKNCQRDADLDSKPKRYDETEELLLNMGLGKSSSFLLERKKGSNNRWIWTGRNTTEADEKLIKYQMADWGKLMTLEKYLA